MKVPEHEVWVRTYAAVIAAFMTRDFPIISSSVKAGQAAEEAVKAYDRWVNQPPPEEKEPPEDDG